jgi:hypothetical protein
MTEGPRPPTPEECPYEAESAIIIDRVYRARGVPGLTELTVIHDDWCPALGGDGAVPCRPEYEMTIGGITAPIHLDTFLGRWDD